VVVGVSVCVCLCVGGSVCLSVRRAATAHRSAAFVSAAKVMRCIQCSLVNIVSLSSSTPLLGWLEVLWTCRKSFGHLA